MLKLWKLTGEIRQGAPFSKNLREMVAPETAFIKLILINSIAVSILSLIIPVSVQSIITNLGILNVTQPIVVMSFVLFVVLIFSGGIQVIQFYVIEILRRRLFLRYGEVILNHSMRYLDRHFQSINRSHLAKRFTDVLMAQSSMIIFFVDGIGFVVQFLITMILLCLYHPYFLIFGVFITFLLFMSWKLFGPAGVEAGTPEADTRYEVMSWVDEVLRVRPLFMSKKGRHFSEKHFISLIEKWDKKRENLFRQQFAQSVAIQIINSLVYTLVLGIGYLLVKKGELSVGQLVAAFIVVTMLLSSLPRLQNFYISVYDFSTNLDKLAEFWSHPLEEEKTEIFLPNGPLSFSFENTEYDEDVKFNFKVREGERVYIYVRSFAAARTLVLTLEGFVFPKKGEMRIHDIRKDELNFSVVRSHLSVIGEGRFVASTIKNNLVGFMESPATITQMEDALETVGLLDKIKSLPDGLETQLLSNGFPLSISETIALQAARVLVMKPSIVIVTSDFDKMAYEKRKKVKEALLKDTAPWTLVFLTQKILRGDFDRFGVLERAGLRELSSEASLFMEVEKYE